MKFIHLSDLHLGKRVNDFSMQEDQEFILKKIINVIDDEKPDGVLIAGDVYDRSIPSEEAMKLWDDFLISLSKRDLQVFVIYGNHDSAVRLSDHNKLIESTGIHISPIFDGKMDKYTMTDEYGKVNIYMLPFIKPVIARAIFPDKEINDYTDACIAAIQNTDIDENERNILIAHQFVTGASRCESEEITVGGLDNVDVTAFDSFDYVALGHIHGKQHIGRDTVRYCGTPLKYSFSEKDHVKSVTVIDIGEKNPADKKCETVINEVPLEMLHDLREIRGSYDELVSKTYYENTKTDDYIHVILTDEEDILDAMGKLRVIYKNLMKLSYDNKRTRENREISDADASKNKSPLELFEEFYEMQNNQPMSDEQRNYSLDLIQSIWEG